MSGRFRRRRRFAGRLLIVMLAAAELGKLNASCCRSMAAWACAPLAPTPLDDDWTAARGCGLPSCPVCYPHQHPTESDTLAEAERHQEGTDR